MNRIYIFILCTLLCISVTATANSSKSSSADFLSSKQLQQFTIEYGNAVNDMINILKNNLIAINNRIITSPNLSL